MKTTRWPVALLLVALSGSPQALAEPLDDQYVAVLDNEVLDAGAHAVQFDGTDLASGVLVRWMALLR